MSDRSRKRPTGIEERPAEREPGNRTGEPPHHALSNPVDEPDPTEFPDPYEKREDPRDQGHADPSTSEPHGPRGTEQVRGGKDEHPRPGKGRRQ
jgi:hypothetical protein